MLLWTSSSCCRICGHKLSGTYILEHAEHFWPPYSNAERIVPITTLWMSAEVCTKWKFFPPHSDHTDIVLRIRHERQRTKEDESAHLRRSEETSCRCPGSAPPVSTDAWRFWRMRRNVSTLMKDADPEKAGWVLTAHCQWSWSLPGAPRRWQHPQTRDRQQAGTGWCGGAGHTPAALCRRRNSQTQRCHWVSTKPRSPESRNTHLFFYQIFNSL